MAKLLLIVISLCFGCAALAQHDPVLMRINGENILRSEFQYNYSKYEAPAGEKQKAVKDYVNQFVNFKLKVAAAKAAGIDTTLAFRNELEEYRWQLAASYLTDEEEVECVARRFYNKMKESRREGQVFVSHIFKKLPQAITANALRRIELEMDSIYELLKRGGPNVDFNAYVKRYSDEKDSFWVSCLQMPVEFEDVIFDLKPGSYSRPFFTPQGIHIVKVIERKALPPFEEMKHEIIRWLTRSHGMDKGTEITVEKLKKEYRYTLDKAAVDELILKGQTDRTLFTLAGKAYNGKDFARFASAHPEGVQRQFAGFVMKSVLDYENSQLEQKYPEFRNLMQRHRENALLTAITEREMKAEGGVTEAGMKKYFEEHRSEYRWSDARYKGIVLHCVSKRVAKHARKFLKHLPANEWQDGLRLTFNAGQIPQVQAEQGVFAPGDNAYVDDLAFNGKEAASPLSFPFTVILGKKLKGPEDYREVRAQLTADYQNYLEQRWVAKLHAAAKVEINQEVLKTVNNH